MTDILWSDPQESKPGWVLLPKSSGLYFGADVSKKFNHINNFQMIARAHQLIMTVETSLPRDTRLCMMKT
jgi:diadenosine tetraphosphatase ApaH/serine/threonine PP2A family protein phosphatase